jgi:hypothetical protein
MRKIWEIAGQPGSTFGSNWRSLPEIQAFGTVLKRTTLASDTLSWTVWLEDNNEGPFVPQLGQEISLRLRSDDNSGSYGVRHFFGTVTKRQFISDPAGPRYRIECENAWWYLKQMMISSQGTDLSGASRERTSFTLAQGNISTHLRTIAARAIALGAPITLGAFASAFTVPQLSVRNSSVAEALTDLMRWLPDGTLYFDYSGTTTPQLCLTRRLTSPNNLVVLDANTQVLPLIDLNPRLDLRVQKVKVVHAVRKTTTKGRVVAYEELVAGPATNPLLGHQKLTTSGEDVDTFLPRDWGEIATVKSAPAKTELGLIALIKKYEKRLLGDATGFRVGQVILPDQQPGSGASGGGSLILYSQQPHGFPTSFSKLEENEPDLPANYNYFLSTFDPAKIPDWFERDEIPIRMAKVRVSLYTLVEYSKSPGNGFPPPLPPAWFKKLGGEAFISIIKVQGSSIDYNYLWSVNLELTVPMTSKNYPANTIIAKAEDYGFISPPAGLAGDLLAAQNWLPYEGEISLVGVPLPPGNQVGAALNLLNVRPEHANMKALIHETSHTLATGETSYLLGSPARESYLTLANRFRSTGHDNIEYIGGSRSGGGFLGQIIGQLF